MSVHSKMRREGAAQPVPAMRTSMRQGTGDMAASEPATLADSMHQGGKHQSKGVVGKRLGASMRQGS